MRLELEGIIRENRHSNEEARQLNHELQGANEELRMNKLELQSVNEALTTTNGRLHAKMLELRAANDDLDSLLSSTNIAVLFLDPGFRVRRYTPAIQDLLGGRLDYLFVNTSEAAPLVKAGKVRAIGVSSLKRLPLMPEVPTLDEAGVKGYETVSWGGVVAPKGTPDDVVATLNAAIQKALQAPDVRAGLARLGAEPAGGSPADFKKLIDRETAKWRGIIEYAGIEKLD